HGALEIEARETRATGRRQNLEGRIDPCVRFLSSCPDCGGTARFGHLDMRAQVEVPSALRPDTPRSVSPKRATSPTLSFDIFHQLIPILESKRTGDQKLSIGQRQRITFIL